MSGMTLDMVENMSFDTEQLAIHDVIIIGAGPCGLAVASRLKELTPSSLFTDVEHQRYHWLRSRKGTLPVLKTKGRAQQKTVIEGEKSLVHEYQNSSEYSIRVLDSTAPNYLGKWKTLFQSLEIKTLRSPLFFHVDPRDRDGLKEFVYSSGRENEIMEIRGVVGKEKSKHQVKKERRKRSSKQTHRYAVLALRR